MPLRVVSFCSYLTSGERRPKDYDTYKFVQAIKGCELNGYASVPVCGRSLHLNNRNRAETADWFAEMATDYLRGTAVKTPLMLIPVPSSNMTVGASSDFTALRLARAMAVRLNDGTEVHDCLRWSTAMEPAHDGGTRDARCLYSRLRLRPPVLETARARPVVLLDDVLTTGGHLRACAARLTTAGHPSPRLAMVVARTDWEPQPEAFQVREEELEDYQP